FLVHGTNGPLTINPLAGENTISLGSGGSPPFMTSTISGILGAVTVIGLPSGTNTVAVNDQSNTPNAGRVYTLTGTGLNSLNLTRVDPTTDLAPIILGGISSFTLNASCDVNVLSTPFGTTTTVNAWQADNRVLVGGGLPGSLGAIGSLNVNGKVSGTTLVFNDQFSPANGRVYTLTPTSFA